MSTTKLNIDLRVGEALTIGGARLVLVEKSGQRARLEVHAEKNTLITFPGRKPVSHPSAQECASSPAQGKE